jgi:hypothetical protein
MIAERAVELPVDCRSYLREINHPITTPMAMPTATDPTTVSIECRRRRIWCRSGEVGRFLHRFNGWPDREEGITLKRKDFREGSCGSSLTLYCEKRILGNQIEESNLH